MNTFMNTNIKATCGYLKAFEQSLKMSAMRDDGQLDRQEEKLLKKVNSLTEKYIRSLENLLDE